MMRKILVFFFFMFGMGTMLIAQDTMIKTNDEVIKCKITQIGTDEIHYKQQNYRDDLSFSIDKNLVKKIILEEGDEIVIEHSMFGKVNYEDQRKNAIKVGFLSPLFGATKIAYERSLAPGKSMEFTLGIIGAGMDTYDIEGKGGFLKVGYKFIKSPDYYIKGMRYAHLLKGLYVRPEIALSVYSYKEWDFWEYEEERRREDTNYVCALLLNFGKQWVFNDQFVVDLFAGVGYGFGENDLDNPNHFAFSGACDGVPIALSSGLRIGFLFNK